jgi:hypothetical protein
LRGLATLVRPVAARTASRRRPAAGPRTPCVEAIADADAGNFGGKVVIDAANPLDFSGGFPPSWRSAARTRSGSAFSGRCLRRRS